MLIDVKLVKDYGKNYRHGNCCAAEERWEITVHWNGV